jgi:hypothetical protein
LLAEGDKVQNHLFSIYHDIGGANDVVDQLLAAGVGKAHISVLTSETSGARHLALVRGRETPESAKAGLRTGGAVGLLDGGLITATTAGVGVLAVGPLVSALSRLNARKPGGGLADALTGAGIPEAEARLYASRVADLDAILIGVEMTHAHGDNIRQIMNPEKRRPGLLSRV